MPATSGWRSTATPWVPRCAAYSSGSWRLVSSQLSSISATPITAGRVTASSTTTIGWTAAKSWIKRRAWLPTCESSYERSRRLSWRRPNDDLRSGTAAPRDGAVGEVDTDRLLELPRPGADRLRAARGRRSAVLAETRHEDGVDRRERKVGPASQRD